MHAAMSTVIGGEGNWRLWKKDELDGVEGAVTTFYFSSIVIVQER